MGSKQTLPTLINRFDGPWYVLSNFYPCLVEYQGLTYPSVEHAYQAAKALDAELRKPFTALSLEPGKAKHMGNNLLLRTDWEQVKLDIMRELVATKFSAAILKRKLLSTFSAELIEGNWWHDIYWGVCNGSGTHWKCPGHAPIGENNLGKILMEIRKSYIV